MLFYHYQILFGKRLPFGKRIPPQEYIYVMGVIIDPLNSLSLRQDPEQYMFSMGGVGLLEKDLFRNVHNADLKSAFNGILAGSNDPGNITGYFARTAKRMAKLGRIASRLSQISDDEKLNKIQCTALVKKFKRQYEATDLSRVPTVHEKVRDIFKLSDMVINNDLSSGDHWNLILSEVRIKMDTDRIKLSDIIEPLSIEVWYLTKDLYKKMNANKDSSKETYLLGWFLKLISDSANSPSRFISRYFENVSTSRLHQNAIKHHIGENAGHKLIVYIEKVMRNVQEGLTINDERFAKYEYPDVPKQISTYENGKVGLNSTTEDILIDQVISELQAKVAGDLIGYKMKVTTNQLPTGFVPKTVVQPRPEQHINHAEEFLKSKVLLSLKSRSTEHVPHIFNDAALQRILSINDFASMSRITKGDLYVTMGSPTRFSEVIEKAIVMLELCQDREVRIRMVFELLELIDKVTVSFSLLSKKSKVLDSTGYTKTNLSDLHQYTCQVVNRLLVSADIDNRDYSSPSQNMLAFIQYLSNTLRHLVQDRVGQIQ
jgi:hypothetical protein